MAEQGWLYQLAALPAKLTAGKYRLVADWSAQTTSAGQSWLGFGLLPVQQVPETAKRDAGFGA